MDEISEISVGQFDTVSQLIASSLSLQLAVIGLIIGIFVISIVYRKFSRSARKITKWFTLKVCRTKREK